MFNIFNPKNPSKKSMIRLGEHIEKYVDELESSMIIPDDLMNKKKEIDKGIEITRKLIKKLKKGDKSVFDIDKY